jgi:hypothetical protein
LIVTEPPVPGFIDFLQTNERVWQSHLAERRTARQGVILVELIHNNAAALCANLLVARYLAEFVGADVLGFTAPTFTSHRVPINQIRALAASYGVVEVVEVEHEPKQLRFPGLSLLRAITRNGGKWSPRASHLSTLTGAALRKALLGLTIDNVWIGDLVYDSYLSGFGQATIDRFDDDLAHTLNRTANLHAGINQLFRRYQVHATVVCHTVFIEYGLPARLSLKHGVPVYGKWGTHPFIIRKYRSLAEAPIFPGTELESVMRHYRTRLGEELASLANEFYPPSPHKVSSFDYFRLGYGDDKNEESAKSLAKPLRLDPSKKTCCIMSPMFNDSPHCIPDLLFDDYYQWLDATLSFALRNPTINWLVRQHPYEILVGQNKNFNNLVRPYVDSGAVTVVPNDVTTSSLFSCVDVITIVNGSAGIEFASVGIPCVYAGKPYYAECPFVIRPSSRAKYFEALAGIPTLPRIPPDQIKLAKETAYIALNCLPAFSQMLPKILDLAGRNITGEDLRAWWDDAANRAKSIAPRDDPFYRNLYQLFSGKETTLLKYE